MSQKLCSLISLIVLIVLSIHQQAQAGPPLICHPFDIGNARSLPWSGSQWREVKRDYPLNRLVEDTLALLNQDTPVIVRMETLRRAAMYSSWAIYDKEVGYQTTDLKVAQALMARLQERVEATQRKDALALFDAGYFIETLKDAGYFGAMKKQATGHADHDQVTNVTNVNGYELVKQASGQSSAMTKQKAAMEFAAALIRYDDQAIQRAHLQKAVAGADADALLSRNLVLHFSDRGRDLAALRASLR